MKLAVALLSVFVAAAVFIPAAGTYRVPVWDGARYVWPLLGPTLTVHGGYLDVVLPGSPAPRRYNIPLPWDQVAGGYRFPVAPKNEACYVNGFRYRPTGNYTITGDLLLPGTGGNWPPGAEAEVICDYDP